VLLMGALRRGGAMRSMQCLAQNGKTRRDCGRKDHLGVFLAAFARFSSESSKNCLPEPRFSPPLELAKGKNAR
jgi:hypothetical protein